MFGGSLARSRQRARETKTDTKQLALARLNKINARILHIIKTNHKKYKQFTCKSLLKQDSSKCRWHILTFSIFGRFALFRLLSHFFFRLSSFVNRKKVIDLSLLFLKLLLLQPNSSTPHHFKYVYK